MTGLPMRSILPTAVLVGLIAGCSRATQTSREEAPDTTEQRPPRHTTLTAEDIARNPGEPIEMQLEGRFAGVQVFRTAAGIAVRIRGTSSFYSSNEPLYVLDGTPIQPGPHGALNGINPYDIESIEVLKDPVSTAMYGMRGANGVIVIKTKRSGP